MTIEADAFADSRAALIGVSAYEYAEFPPIRAARNSLEAMRAMLSEPALCGWPPDRITVISNPVSPVDVAVQLTDLAEAASGVFLLYYVGHGALSPRGELCLTMTSTRPDRAKVTGLAWETVADVMRASPARMRLVILDCCFAGQAIETLSSDPHLGLADITHVEGVCTLTATVRNRTAHVLPPGQQDDACTSFTGELLDLVRSGLPGKPARLTIGDIYPELRQRLVAKGLPAPNQRGTDTAHEFPFATNAVAGISPPVSDRSETSTYDPAETPVGGVVALPEYPDRDRAGNLVDQVLRVTYSMADVAEKMQILVQAAKLMNFVDPGRASRLLADVERVAYSVTDVYGKGKVLMQAAKLLESVDLGRASHLLTKAAEVLLSIPSETIRNSQLKDFTVALADSDPDQAERLAESITNKHDRELALWHIAEVLAGSDPDRAERLAQSITKKSVRAIALTHIVEVLAPSDPDRAERLAQSISDEPDETLSVPYSWRASALRHVASALAPSDPDRAWRLAESITDSSARESALAYIVRVLAGTDPDRAKRLALSLSDEPEKKTLPRESPQASAMASIACALADTEPDQAERIAQLITHTYRKEQTLARVVSVLAVSDSDRAWCLAQSITIDSCKDQALSRAANALADIDPDAAERFARAILTESDRARALARLARKLAVTDPDRAASLLTDEKHTIQGVFEITEKSCVNSADSSVAQALATVAQALATAGQSSIERAAESFSDEVSKILELAGTDPEQAERAAYSIGNQHAMALALRGIAGAIVIADPDRGTRLIADVERIESELRQLESAEQDLIAELFTRAERVAQAIKKEDDRDSALRSVAELLVVTDPGRSERLVMAIRNETSKISAFRSIAELLARTNPDEAARLAHSITYKYDKASALCGIARSLANIEPIQATRFLDDAERVAHSLTKDKLKATMLLEISNGWAGFSWDSAN
jgi:hypothetical protein